MAFTGRIMINTMRIIKHIKVVNTHIALTTCQLLSQVLYINESSTHPNYLAFCCFN